MLKQIYKNNLTVNYKIEGHGNVIILIHGFLETSEICTTHAKDVYANDNLNVFSKEIAQGIFTAKGINSEGITASIETMRDRKDRNKVLKNCKVPFLYIIGLKDNFISENIIKKISMPEKYSILSLKKSGHMGMVEEKEKSLKSITEFYNDYIRT